MNVGFISLGCPKNQVDTELMLDRLKRAGHKIVNSAERADAVIINTCGFITEAKEESINTIIEIGQLKNSGVVQYIIATGCLAQRYSQELMAEMPELDAILGISTFKDIDQVLDRVVSGEKVLHVQEAPQVFMEGGPRVLTTPPGMAYLKISEGCNNHCSYCAIPSIRGNLRSRPSAEIAAEAKSLAKKNVKELVLIAQDTAGYGLDLYGHRVLPDLLESLCQVEGIEWIRLMYLHPAHIDSRLVEMMAVQNKIIPYMDIPIQHVSSRVLASMNRKHDNDHLYQLLETLRRDIDGLVLRTTVMTGFPGENEDDFQQLFDFVAAAKFDWLGAFAYAAEEGTRAAEYQPQIPDEVKQQRRDLLLNLQKEISREKNIARTGKIENILISSQVDSGMYLGRGYFQAPDVDGLTMVKTPLKLTRGEFYPVHLKGVRGYDMVGETVDDLES